jgi:hypothetical protein
MSEGDVHRSHRQGHATVRAGKARKMIRAAIERIHQDATFDEGATVADSRLEGFVVIAFWSGGRITPPNFAVTHLLSPELDPAAVHPILRDVANRIQDHAEAGLADAQLAAEIDEHLDRTRDAR